MAPDQSSFVASSLKRHTAQLQALFGPVSPNYAQFDIVFIRVSEKYVARAIVYMKNGFTGKADFTRWTSLVEGSSEVGILNAMEDPWTVIEDRLSKNTNSEHHGAGITNWY